MTTRDKKKHSQSAPTLPPPPPSSRRGKQHQPTARPPVRRKTVPRAPAAKQSEIKRRKAPHESDIPGATVDEVVADLSRDPRRDSD